MCECSLLQPFLPAFKTDCEACLVPCYTVLWSIIVPVLCLLLAVCVCVCVCVCVFVLWQLLPLLLLVWLGLKSAVDTYKIFKLDSWIKEIVKHWWLPVWWLPVLWKEIKAYKGQKTDMSHLDGTKRSGNVWHSYWFLGLKTYRQTADAFWRDTRKRCTVVLLCIIACCCTLFCHILWNICVIFC